LSTLSKISLAVPACDLVGSELDCIESRKTRLIREPLPILSFPLDAVAMATLIGEWSEIVMLGSDDVEEYSLAMHTSLACYDAEERWKNVLV
jgi:hypothetical protein